jgi:hypothetical protein
MYKKYQVTLTAAERQHLTALLSAGTLATAANTHARILLKADAASGGPAWPDVQISEAFVVSIRTVVRVRQAFVTHGLTPSVHRQPRSGPPRRKMDGAREAQLVALVCSGPPAGHARWTLHLLTDKFVELVDLDSIAPETVRQTLKKTNLNLG